MSNISTLIGKLIRHEKSARTIGNIDEAAAFSQKVQELLFKHKLEMSDVEQEVEDSQEPIDDVVITPADMGLTPGQITQDWAKSLIYHVAKGHFCETVLRKYKEGNRTFHNLKGSFFLVGRFSDREIVLDLSRFLIATARSMSEQVTEAFRNSSDFWRTIGRTTETERAIIFRYKRSWLLGFTQAIYSRLEKTTLALTEGASGEQGLVLVQKNAAAIESFKKKRFKDLKNGRKTKREIDLDAYNKGKEYGNSVTLTKRKALTA